MKIDNRVIGYLIGGGSSNDAEFFDGNQPQGTLCPECDSCLNPLFVPKHLKVNRSKKYDICYTHDLRTLFSERLVDFLKNELGCKEDFYSIETEFSRLFYCFPKVVVPFDCEKRQTRFINRCSSCEGFKEIIGATPAFVKQENLLGSGLFRTNISFGSGRSKHHLLIIGSEWMAVLRSMKFRGMAFHEVYSSIV
jgi:hypothetical protein